MWGPVSQEGEDMCGSLNGVLGTKRFGKGDIGHQCSMFIWLLGPYSVHEYYKCRRA